MAATGADDDKARYQALKRELLSALPKKRNIDRQLASVEVQIYNLEGTYLTETAAHSGGNIIHGFENYLKNQNSGRRKSEALENERIFSSSSLTYQRSLDLEGEEHPGNDDYSKQATPGVTTVLLPPATKNQELTIAQQNKLARDKEYQRRKRANRRSVGTASDEESTPSTSGRRPIKRARMDDD